MRRRYNWFKNGKPFQWAVYDTRISQQPDRGTLVITSPKDEDIGGCSTDSWVSKPSDWDSAVVEFFVCVVPDFLRDYSGCMQSGIVCKITDQIAPTASFVKTLF